MRKLFLSVLLFVPSQWLLAQTVTGYQLSDFKFRTKGYTAMTLTGDFEGTGITVPKDTAASFSNTFVLSAALNFTDVYSLDNKQQVINKGANLYSRLALSGGGHQTEFSFDPSGYYQNETRVYKEHFFYQYGYSGRGGIYTSGYEPKFSMSLAGSASGAIGRGRLESVGDAQTALFILEDLYREGKIGEVDKETADRFAHLITEIKNRRVFDYRRKTMFQLEQVDSFLRKNTGIKECDAKTFAIINDNLYYSSNNDMSSLVSGLHTPIGNDPLYFGETLLNERDPGGVFTANTSYGYDASAAADPFNSPFRILRHASEQTPRFNGSVMYILVDYGDLISSSGNGYNSPFQFYSNSKYSARDIFGNVTHYPASTKFYNPLDLLKKPIIVLDAEKHQAVNLHWQKIYTANIMTLVKPANGSGDKVAMDVYLSYGIGYYPDNRTTIEGQVFTEFTPLHVNTADLIPTPSAALLYSKFISYNTVVRANADLFTGRNMSKKFGATLNFSVHLLHYFF